MKKIVCFIIVSFSLIYLGWHSENLRITNLDKTVKITVESDYHRFSGHDIQNFVITDGDVIKQIVNSFKNVRFRKPINYRCEPYATLYELTFWDDNNQLIAGIGIVRNDKFEYGTGHGKRLYYVTKGQIDYDSIENLFETIENPNTLIYDENTYIPEEVGTCGLIVYENEAKGIAPGTYLLSSDKTYTINHGIIGKNRWNNEVLEHEPTCTCKLAIHNSDHIEIYSYCAECGILYDWHDCCYLELTEESQHTINDVLSSYLYGDVN